MKYIYLLIVSVIIFSSTGCNNSAADNDTASKPADPAPAVDAVNGSRASTPPNTIQNNSAADNVIQPVQPVTTSTAGLNPAHGQPGHRCDIAVGAPLDSKSTTTVQNPPPAPTTVTKPVPVTTTTTNTNTATVPAGINPAHGQPGHRCDIAVGAPLNSKPTQPAAVQTTTTNPAPVISQPPLITPALPVTTPVSLPAAGGGLNPEHGKPGHRCDIAVGAPLNSKSKQ